MPNLIIRGGRTLAVFTVSILLLSALGVSDVAAAVRGKGGTGFGVILGEPSGFTLKHWLASSASPAAKEAVDIGLAFSFNSFFLIYGDYLWHFPQAFSGYGATTFTQNLTPYLGVGGELFVSTESGRDDRKYFTESGSTAGFGIRIPLGLEWRPSNPPLGVFLELVPGVGVIPRTFGFFQGGMGVRYYF